MQKWKSIIEFQLGKKTRKWKSIIEFQLGKKIVKYKKYQNSRCQTIGIGRSAYEGSRL
jgi:hypothetical protein